MKGIGRSISMTAKYALSALLISAAFFCGSAFASEAVPTDAAVSIPESDAMNSLLLNAGNDFSIISKLTGFNGLDREKNYDITGIYEYNIRTDGTKIGYTGDLNGRFGSHKADLSEDINMLIDGATLGSSSVVCRFDLSTGIMYMNVSGEQMPGMENTWYEIDIRRLMNGYGSDYDELVQYLNGYDAYNAPDISEAFGLLLEGSTDPSEIYRSISTGYEVLKNLIGDNAFTEDPELNVTGIAGIERAYVADFSSESIMNVIAAATGIPTGELKAQNPFLYILTEYDIQGKLMIGLDAYGNACAVAFTAACNEVSTGNSAGISYGQTSSDLQTILTFNTGDMEYLGNMYMHYAETAEAVDTLPPYGVNPIDITELLTDVYDSNGESISIWRES